jgi:CBS domain containing-hemolysin-like protein
MSNLPWPVVVALTIAFIVLSAFFVAVEFALLAAKRHRLEDMAPRSRAARAALRSSSELTVLLAGSQLGITACALALGAITKPAVHYAISPVVVNLGAPYWIADVIGFVLALIVVAFLQLVVGEMAPKSWAIAHPELSATMLALPMRAFMAVFRPLLIGLNEAANWCLRRVGVEPVDHIASGSNPDDLRHLVEHSATVGAIDVAYSDQLANALDLRRLTLADLVADQPTPVALPTPATAGEVRDAARTSGHLRILLQEPGAPVPTGVVHVRDTLMLATGTPVTEITREILQMPADTALHAALTRMRETSNHLAIVPDAAAGVRVVTLADVLAQLFPRTTAEAGAGPGGTPLTESAPSTATA